MTNEELFADAFGKIGERKDIAKTRRTRIKAFLDSEQPGRTQERKELKNAIGVYLKLMSKVRKAKENPEDEKDPIAQAFSKVNDIVSVFRKLGIADRLSEYFLLLTDCSVTLTGEDWRLVKATEAVDGLESKVKEYDEASEKKAEEIKELAKEAEENNICLASRFGKLIKIADKKKKNDEDADDLVQKEYLMAELINTGVESVLEITGGK